MINFILLKMTSKSFNLNNVKTISECVDTENVYFLEYDSIENVFLISNLKIDQSEIDTVVKSKFQINGMSEILDSQKQFLPQTYILTNAQHFENFHIQKTLDDKILKLKVSSELITNDNFLKDYGSNILKQEFIAINQNQSF